jgi:hypothetical protein
MFHVKHSGEVGPLFDFIKAPLSPGTEFLRGMFHVKHLGEIGPLFDFIKGADLPGQ